MATTDLIDMKRSAPDPESGCECMPCAPDSDEQYPWGLQIRLGEEELAKLGFTALPPVMSEVNGMFVGIVTATNQEVNGDQERSISIQITLLQAEVEKEQPGESDTAAAENAENKSPGMYRGMKKPAVIVD